MIDHTQTTDLERFRVHDDPAEQARLWLDAGRALARQGDTEGARRMVQAAAQADPGCVEAWLGLAWLTPDAAQRGAYLRRVLALDPNHARARAELDKLDQGPVRQSAGARRWTLAGLLVAALAFLAAVLVWGPVDESVAWLLPTPTPAPSPTPTQAPRAIAVGFIPQLKTALAEASWDRALDIVDIMFKLAPADSEVRGWAAQAHLEYGQSLAQSGQLTVALGHLRQAVALAPENGAARLQYGQALVKAGQLEAALVQLDQAAAQEPANADAQRWQQGIRAYLAGRQAAAAGDWSAAIEAFAQVQTNLPGTLDEAGRLADAYRERGIARHKAGKLAEARKDLEAALALRPGDAQARAELEQVMLELFPPKRIEVDISKQHFYAYEGNTLVYSFATSTGLPGRDTAPGHFKVLDKIPMAYSSIWHLKMPYWLGIYYVGGIENGIHALPIRPDGTVMWGGLLGTPQSYGCVILSTEAAALIYEWADVGTTVDIHY